MVCAWPVVNQAVLPHLGGQHAGEQLALMFQAIDAEPATLQERRSKLENIRVCETIHSREFRIALQSAQSKRKETAHTQKPGRTNYRLIKRRSVSNLCGFPRLIRRKSGCSGLIR